MSLRKFLAWLTVAVVVIMALLIWFFPSHDDFRSDNPFWNGASRMGSTHRISSLSSFSRLPASAAGTTLILIPYSHFTPVELDALRNFIAEGGTLVLADDYGDGNEVLSYLGLKERFSRQVLLDPIANYKNQHFPKIFDFTPDPLIANVTDIVFDHATALTGTDAANVLAYSSRFSYLDANDNGVEDEKEPAGPLPVISRHSLGKGQIVLIADPSLFINGMEGVEGNARFIQNIAAGSATLFMDQSHLAGSTSLGQAKDLLSAVRAPLTSLPGAIGVAIVVLAVALRPVWKRRPNVLKGDADGNI